MAHYCIFCERSFATFTKLRQHPCRLSGIGNSESVSPGSDWGKENWVRIPFNLVSTKIQRQIS